MGAAHHVLVFLDGIYMQQLCIFSHDRIFSLLVSKLVRSRFSLTIAHDQGSLSAWLTHEEPALLVCDTAILDASTLNALRTHQSVHHGWPHVLLFVSLTELQSLELGSLPDVDHVLLKPARSEEIMRTVMKMTAKC